MQQHNLSFIYLYNKSIILIFAEKILYDWYHFAIIYIYLHIYMYIYKQAMFNLLLAMALISLYFPSDRSPNKTIK